MYNIETKQQDIKIRRKQLSPSKLSAGQLVDIYRRKLKKLKEMNIELNQKQILIDRQDIIEFQDNNEKYNPQIKSKLELFYKVLEEEKENDIKFRKRKEREKQFLMKKNNQSEQNEKDKKVLDEQDQIQYKTKQIKKNPEYPTENNIMLQELGIKADGQALGTGQYLGLGFDDKKRSSQDDAFAKFRQKQSQFYHQTVEERSYVREKSEICYKCNQPGHIARDCKYGLT